MWSRLPSNRLEAARRRATRSSCAGCLREIRLGYLGVDDDRRARFLDEGDLPDAKRADQLLGNYAQRSRRWSLAGRWLGVGCRSRGVEGNVAFHFLQDLVDMAVQH